MAEHGVLGEAVADPLDGQTKYRKVQLLGRGTSGTVYLAEEVATGQKWAIKLVRRGYADLPSRGPKWSEWLENEVLNLRHLRHPYVVGFREVFLTESHLGLVMEYVHGGTLAQLVQAGGPLAEHEARFFLHKLVAALTYCHAKQVANRDIKADNVLIGQDTNPWMVKLCDFGFSKETSGPNNEAASLVGTPVYCSPEVMSAHQAGPYNALKADIWSCGVLLYYALTGQFPWIARDEEGMDHAKQWNARAIARLRTGRYEGSRLAHLSSECRDLIAHLLVVDPSSRLDVLGITCHPWFREGLPVDYGTLVVEQPLFWEQRWEPPVGQQSKEDVVAVLAEARHLAPAVAASVLQAEGGSGRQQQQYRHATATTTTTTGGTTNNTGGGGGTSRSQHTLNRTTSPVSIMGAMGNGTSAAAAAAAAGVPSYSGVQPLQPSYSSLQQQHSGLQLQQQDSVQQQLQQQGSVQQQLPVISVVAGHLQDMHIAGPGGQRYVVPTTMGPASHSGRGSSSSTTLPDAAVRLVQHAADVSARMAAVQPPCLQRSSYNALTGRLGEPAARQLQQQIEAAQAGLQAMQQLLRQL